MPPNRRSRPAVNGRVMGFLGVRDPEGDAGSGAGGTRRGAASFGRVRRKACCCRTATPRFSDWSEARGSSVRQDHREQRNEDACSETDHHNLQQEEQQAFPRHHPEAIF